MDPKSNHKSPVPSDSKPLSKSRLGLPSNLTSFSSPATAYNPSDLSVTVPRRKPSAKVGAWLDAMIASSPPRRKKNKDFSSELDEFDTAYTSWMTNYPSALASFEKIANHAKGKKIALFLDYDGTLSPIVDHPEHAIMSNSMRAAVKQAAELFPTAIISGRSRDKVFEFVKLRELYYAGSHGMDIMGPGREPASVGELFCCTGIIDPQDKEVILFQPASAFLPKIDKLYGSLIDITKDISGAKIEYNKFCVSVHYRLVDIKNLQELAQRVYDLLSEYEDFRVTHGRKVLEIRPAINWNKGRAVEFLLDSLGLSGRKDVLPIYIGDDRTDEDAFKVLREGTKGFGILVTSAPKETQAFYSLKDPSEVMEFLKALVRWKKTKKIHI